MVVIMVPGALDFSKNQWFQDWEMFTPNCLR
jgi:hypothetical protein